MSEMSSSRCRGQRGAGSRRLGTMQVQGGVPAGFTPDPTDPTITLPTRTLPTDFTRTLPESIGVGCVPDTLTPRCLDTLLTRGTCLTCGSRFCFH